MKLFSIFGNPVSHSISPKMHNLALEGLKINGCYTRTPLVDGGDLIKKFHALKLDGANVTVPHKESAFSLCDGVDSFAQSIGAVNTLVKKNGLVYGYNTDAPGFYEAIKEFGNISNALVLGAGGTAKAIATVLNQKGITPTILNRSRDRLDYFYTHGFDAFSWDNFKINSYDLIINTTSAGLIDESLPLDTHILNALMKKSKFAFDVIYNKNTPFLKQARENSLVCKDGTDMLLYQGVLAFNLFFNNTLNSKKITQLMRGAFN
jgi:shikimate dehydrogenase